MKYANRKLISVMTLFVLSLMIQLHKCEQNKSDFPIPRFPMPKLSLPTLPSLHKITMPNFPSFNNPFSTPTTPITNTKNSENTRNSLNSDSSPKPVAPSNNIRDSLLSDSSPKPVVPSNNIRDSLHSDSGATKPVVPGDHVVSVDPVVPTTNRTVTHPEDPNNKFNYRNKGKDWPGMCNTGPKQSPVNIVHGGNTAIDTSYTEFSYEMPADASSKKLYYNGNRLYLEINLGNLTYFNSKGAQELYEANRIELHFPSEHYITKDGQTPRYTLELQIYHSLKKTNNQQVTNSEMKVNQAAVSILFTIGELEEGDMFLNSLGISKYNIDNNGKFNIASPEQFILRNQKIPATYGVGFNYLAFQGLLNLINADRKMFFYYGSETYPPCREEVLWMVFSEPRSISKPQFDYLLLTLAKNKQEGMKLTDAKTPNMLFGNKRTLSIYDETSRGKILYNPAGLKNVHKKAFFKN